MIGSGAFGEIYSVEKKLTKQILAMKVERASANQKQIMLMWESKIIKVLKGKTALAGVHFVGQERTSMGKVYHIMIMDLLGESLFEIHNKLNKKFDADTVLNVGI